METVNTEQNAVQEPVVAAQNVDGAAETSEVAVGTPETKQEQGKDTNAVIAAVRKRYEAENSANVKRLAGLDHVAKDKGFDSAEDYIDSILADEQGMTVDEYRRHRTETESAEEQKVLSSPAYKEKAGEVEKLKSDLIQFQMSKDLQTIQKEFPDIKALEDLGDDYPKMITAGIEPLKAARMILGTKPEPPKATGAVGGGSADKDYYTPAEVDALTEKDLDDPKIFEKVRKSMTKW